MSVQKKSGNLFNDPRKSILSLSFWFCFTLAHFKSSQKLLISIYKLQLNDNFAGSLSVMEAIF